MHIQMTWLWLDDSVFPYKVVSKKWYNPDPLQEPYY